MRSITAIAIILAAASASAIEIKVQETRLQPRRPELPPMPMESLSDDPAESVEPAEEADPKSAYAQIVARQQDRAINTQRTARVKGEILAAIETDAKGNKTAKVIRADGSIEMRPSRHCTPRGSSRLLPPHHPSTDPTPPQQPLAPPPQPRLQQPSPKSEAQNNNVRPEWAGAGRRF
jgi:hypothetical protein